MIIKEISIGDIRRIEFKNGLNIIVGTHGKSSNGVGKSLLVAFIRYCFGNGTTLQENLKRYKDILNIENVELILEEVNLKTKKLTRDITDKNINKNKLNIIYPSTKNLTESLILSRFIREPHSYHDYLKSSNTKESNEATQKAVSFLLGLDIERIDKRISFRSELQSLNETKKRLNAIIKEEESRVGINKHEKEKYEADLKDVKIAKNYTTIVEENNKLANALQDKRNQSLQLEYDLESIEKSLYITEDLTKEDVEGFFNEVNFQIPNIIVNRLSDIQNFNRILIQDRQEVLKSQKNAIINDLRQIKNEIQSLEMKVDKNFEYLKER